MELTGITELSSDAATAILYGLVGLSGITLALFIERILVFARSADSRPRVASELARALRTGGVGRVATLFSGRRTMAGRALAAGARAADAGPTAVALAAETAIDEERGRLERGLAFLGTLGNNAPFIGLLGTVLGIITAFADLSATPSAEASRSVMGGISEALVATAVGLMVALPAVVAFNVFQRLIARRAEAARAHVATLRLWLDGRDPGEEHADLAVTARTNLSLGADAA